MNLQRFRMAVYKIRRGIQSLENYYCNYIISHCLLKTWGNMGVCARHGM